MPDSQPSVNGGSLLGDAGFAVFAFTLLAVCCWIDGCNPTQRSVDHQEDPEATGESDSSEFIAGGENPHVPEQSSDNRMPEEALDSQLAADPSHGFRFGGWNNAIPDDQDKSFHHAQESDYTAVPFDRELDLEMRIEQFLDE